VSHPSSDVRFARLQQQAESQTGGTRRLRFASPGVREKLAQDGMDPMPITPAASDAQIRREIDSILALAKAANLKFNGPALVAPPRTPPVTRPHDLPRSGSRTRILSA
jgi:hypothetical protein